MFLNTFVRRSAHCVGGCEPNRAVVVQGPLRWPYLLRKARAQIMAWRRPRGCGDGAQRLRLCAGEFAEAERGGSKPRLGWRKALMSRLEMLREDAMTADQIAACQEAVAGIRGSVPTP